MSRFDAGILARALAAVRGAVEPTPIPAPLPLPSAPQRSPLVSPSPTDDTALAVEIAAALCRRFEGCHLRPYLCPRGIPTIGWGATFYPNGLIVTLKDAPLTQAQADALLAWHVRMHFLPAVRKLCPGIDTPERLGAIVDFAFNLGAGKLATSTLRKRINSRSWPEVPNELRKWNRAGGVVLRGLKLRREAEAAYV